MNTESLQDLLIHYTDTALSAQFSDGHMLQGRNGGYGDLDTPVRNTAHWVYSFSQAYRLTGEDRYLNALHLGVSFITECLASCSGGAVMRHSQTKDSTNGILGPAHVIEALLEAGQVTGSGRYGDLAESYYARHTFNPQLLCWNSTTPAGKTASPDMTFNHQLYFAAVASSLKGEGARRDVKNFVGSLDKTFSIHESGLIRHLIPSQTAKSKASLKSTLSRLLRPQAKPQDNKKEMHYHLYNLYAFSVLKQQVPDFSTSISGLWPRVQAFTDSAEFTAFLQRTETSTDRLQSGSETLVADHVLYRKTFLQEDAARHDARTVAFLKKTQAPSGTAQLFSPDPETQKARIYRYWRLIQKPIQASNPA